MQTRRNVLFGGLAAAVAAAWPWKGKAAEPMRMAEEYSVCQSQPSALPQLGQRFWFNPRYRCVKCEILKHEGDGFELVSATYEREA